MISNTFDLVYDQEAVRNWFDDVIAIFKGSEVDMNLVGRGVFFDNCELLRIKETLIECKKKKMLNVVFLDKDEIKKDLHNMFINGNSNNITNIFYLISQINTWNRSKYIEELIDLIDLKVKIEDVEIRNLIVYTHTYTKFITKINKIALFYYLCIHFYKDSLLLFHIH